MIETPARIKYCDTFLTQLGFSFHSRILHDGGLIIVRKYDSRIDSSITMFFVPFDLTVIWINSNMQVVDKVLAKTWRPGYFSKKPARYTLEIHPDRWGNYEIGDNVEFQDA